LRVGDPCERGGAIDGIAAQDDTERRDLWDARRITSRPLRDAHRIKVAEDICVPRGRIPEMIDRIGALGRRHGLLVAAFGHAGDGNLHVNILSDDDPDDPAVRARIEAAVADLFAQTMDLRGTLSGEHGIGLTKKAY